MFSVFATNSRLFQAKQRNDAGNMHKITRAVKKHRNLQGQQNLVEKKNTKVFIEINLQDCLLLTLEAIFSWLQNFQVEIKNIFQPQEMNLIVHHNCLKLLSTKWITSCSINFCLVTEYNLFEPSDLFSLLVSVLNFSFAVSFKIELLTIGTATEYPQVQTTTFANFF